MREPISINKLRGAIKVKTVLVDGLGTISVRIRQRIRRSAVPSHPIRSSGGWRKSAYVGTRKMVNYA
jgi:hypothetical protein